MHSKTIKCKCKQSTKGTASIRLKKVPQKTRSAVDMRIPMGITMGMGIEILSPRQPRRKLDINNWKTKILQANSLYFKSQTKYFYSHPSKYSVSYGGIAQQCTDQTRPNASLQQWERSVGVFPHGNRGHYHSHLRWFPLLSFPIPKLKFYCHCHFHGIGFSFSLRLQFPWSSLMQISCSVYCYFVNRQYTSLYFRNSRPTGIWLRKWKTCRLVWDPFNEAIYDDFEWCFMSFHLFVLNLRTVKQNTAEISNSAFTNEQTTVFDLHVQWRRRNVKSFWRRYRFTAARHKSDG